MKEKRNHFNAGSVPVDEPREMTSNRKDRFERSKSNDEENAACKEDPHSTESLQKRQNFKDKRGPDKYSFDTADGIKVRLYKGSIVNIKTDAVVNAANGDLDNCGGVAKVISDAAGRALERECEQYIRENGKLNVSGTCVTVGGKLPCKYVIHAVGPDWHDYRGDADVKVTCLLDLADTVKNILRSAEKYQLSTVVMPPLSSGIFAVPSPMCAAMYLKGILDFSSSKRFRFVKEVHIIDIKDEILDLVEKCHRAIRQNKNEIDPQHVYEKYSNNSRTCRYGGEHWGKRQGGSRRREPEQHEQTYRSDYGMTDRNSEPLPENKKNYREKPRKEGNGQQLSKERQDKGDKTPEKKENTTSGSSTGYTAFQIGKTFIYIYTGDIVHLKDIHGLVSQEDQYLNGAGKLASSIKKSAGDKYKKELESLVPSMNSPHPYNNVLVTSAGNMSYSRVFHAVTRQLSDKQQPSKYELDSLTEVVYNILDKADQFVWTWRVWENLRPESFAMPLLGAGALQDKNHIRMCCYATYCGIYEFLRNRLILKIHAIHLVNRNPVFTNCLREVFEEMNSNHPYQFQYTNSGWIAGTPYPYQQMGMPGPYQQTGTQIQYPLPGTPHPHQQTGTQIQYPLPGTPHPHQQTGIPHHHPLKGVPCYSYQQQEQYQYPHPQPRTPMNPVHPGKQHKHSGTKNPPYSGPADTKQFSRQYSSESEPRQRQSGEQLTSHPEHKSGSQYPTTSLQSDQQIHRRRPRHRQFGQGEIYRRPWHEKRQPSAEDNNDLKKQKFDPTKYRCIDTWITEKESTDEGRFERYMQTLTLTSSVEHKSARASTDSGNLNIIDDEDDSSSDDSTSETLGAHAFPAIEEGYDCVICLSTTVNPVELVRCKHKFCRECIIEYFKMKSSCPVCSMVYGEMYGDQPLDGKATVYEDSYSLSGYKCPTLIIAYEFPDGNQEEYHPAPGEPYKGISRQAYLPQNKEGKEILRLLKTAFKQRLVFTIGSSRTSGRDNVVTWNDIHHKTRREGGPERYGYPDDEYLRRVKDELLAKGIE